MNPDTSPLGPATKAIFLEGRDLSTHDAEDLAHAAFASIDTDALADVLSTLTTCDGQPHASELHQHQARAVKNWLTGKDTE